MSDDRRIRYCARVTILLAACSAIVAVCHRQSAAAPLDEPPLWARQAVWYQIFVERWMAGAYPGYVPAGWKVTAWNQDWYEQEDWATADGGGFYRLVQARRFGGDLQGVLDKLDYLQKLGVTAIYFNPLNDSPSLHKYDARHYRHIDRTFGPDPAGDSAVIGRHCCGRSGRSGDMALDRRRSPLPQADPRGASAGHALDHGLLVEPHRRDILGMGGPEGESDEESFSRLVRYRLIR